MLQRGRRTCARRSSRTLVPNRHNRRRRRRVYNRIVILDTFQLIYFPSLRRYSREFRNNIIIKVHRNN